MKANHDIESHCEELMSAVIGLQHLSLRHGPHQAINGMADAAEALLSELYEWVSDRRREANARAANGELFAGAVQ